MMPLAFCSHLFGRLEEQETSQDFSDTVYLGASSPVIEDQQVTTDL